MAQVPVFTLNGYPNGVDNTQREQILYGLVTFTGSGGYTNPGGNPITWTFLSPDGSTFQPAGASSTPFLVYFQPQDNSLVTYQWNKAANKFFAISGGAELTNATTMSGVIAFEAHFGRGV